MGPSLRREDSNHRETNHYVSKMSEEKIVDAPIRRGQPPIAVTLPDGKRLEFAGPVTGSEIATAIGPGLAKAAIALRVDGTPRDLAAVRRSPPGCPRRHS